MEDRCWMQGVQRSAGQCQDKWEGITAGFKKVNDYEKQQVPIGHPSYWQLGSDDKKKLRLPPNFHKEVFNALQEWYVKSRTGDPPGVLFDALAPSRGTGTILLSSLSSFFGNHEIFSSKLSLTNSSFKYYAWSVCNLVISSVSFLLQLSQVLHTP